MVFHGPSIVERKTATHFVRDTRDMIYEIDASKEYKFNANGPKIKNITIFSRVLEHWTLYLYL